MEDLSLIIQSAKEAFDQAATPAALEDAKAVYLGKNGSLTALLKGMAKLSIEEKRARGAEINKLNVKSKRCSIIDVKLWPAKNSTVN